MNLLVLLSSLAPFHFMMIIPSHRATATIFLQQQCRVFSLDFPVLCRIGMLRNHEESIFVFILGSLVLLRMLRLTWMHVCMYLRELNQRVLNVIGMTVQLCSNASIFQFPLAFTFIMTVKFTLHSILLLQFSESILKTMKNVIFDIRMYIHQLFRINVHIAQVL